METLAACLWRLLEGNLVVSRVTGSQSKKQNNCYAFSPGFSNALLFDYSVVLHRLRGSLRHFPH